MFLFELEVRNVLVDRLVAARDVRRTDLQRLLTPGVDRTADE
jgi:hypothetical protein